MNTLSTKTKGKRIKMGYSKTRSSCLMNAKPTFKEFVGGVVTFLAMSYILVVNPGIVSGRFSGNEASGILTSTVVFVATALGSVLATILMALVAKLPVALAPGMGVNAFCNNRLSKVLHGRSAAVSFIGGLIFSINTQMFENIN